MDAFQIYMLIMPRHSQDDENAQPQSHDEWIAHHVPDKSVFMKYLLKSLTENDNQFLPADELFDNVRGAMKNNSDTKPLYGEIKNAGGWDFCFDPQKLKQAQSSRPSNSRPC